MEYFITALEKVRGAIRNAHTWLLIELYKRYNRQKSFRKRSGFEIVVEYYCKEIEDRAKRGIYIPKQKSTSNLITKYLSIRFSRRMRCKINNRNGQEIGRMNLDTPEDISKMLDFIEKHCGSPVSSANIRKPESNNKEAVQKDITPDRKSQEEPKIPEASKELKFTYAGMQDYLKEKEETSVVINRIASMNTSKAEVPDNVEKFILAQFTEENGFTADVASIHSGLREQFNIIWAESTINKINAKYWDIMKGSLITNSENGKYHIRKKQLEMIRHE